MLLPILFEGLDIIGGRTDSDHARVSLVHIINELKTPFLVHELLIYRLALVLQSIHSFYHMLFNSRILLVTVSSWTRIFVEIFHELHLTVKP